MHLFHIGEEYKYDLAEQTFLLAFTFLKRKDLAMLPEGWLELGKGVRASVQHYVTQPAEELLFESHEKFFDVQYLISGEEYIGCVSRKGLLAKAPYSEANDTTLYEEPSFSGRVLLRAGDFAVFAPEDAHKPRCLVENAMAIKKIVVKVPVNNKGH